MKDEIGKYDFNERFSNKKKKNLNFVDGAAYTKER